MSQVLYNNYLQIS